jgi:SSS family solute:Na+ symporter
MHLSALIVVALYMVGMLLIGIRFAGRQTSTETYFVARRSVPAWAMGFSLFATIISSVTFVAYPGSAYAGNWSLLVPGIMVLGVLLLIGLVVIPFFRHVVRMSAYEYLGKRFGTGARMYGSFAFALTTFAKMTFVFYLVALTINSMTGWSIVNTIIAIGVVTVFYSLVGGVEAVIWTDVVQGFVLWLGIFITLGYLLFSPPGGPAAVFSLAWRHGKFGLGSTSINFSQPTIIVLLLYGFFWFLQKYTGDQTVVQRYLVARSDREALKGVAMGALLSIPVWTLFMLIGTSTWAFYQLAHAKLPDYIKKADQVFPYFLTSRIPGALSGLIVASLLAAAMSTLSSDLNCLAVVGVEDFYRTFRRNTSDRERLNVGKAIVAACGALCIVMAMILAHSHGTALSLWYTASAIVAGGLAGLFFLAFLSTRANKQGAYIGIGACLIFTAWATLTLHGKQTIDLGRYNFPLHSYMIGVIGNIVIFAMGYAASFLFQRGEISKRQMTLWGWRERTRSGGLERIETLERP